MDAPNLGAAPARGLRLPDLHGAAEGPVELFEALQVTLVVYSDLNNKPL